MKTRKKKKPKNPSTFDDFYKWFSLHMKVKAARNEMIYGPNWREILHPNWREEFKELYEVDDESQRTD